MFRLSKCREISTADDFSTTQLRLASGRCRRPRSATSHSNVTRPPGETVLSYIYICCIRFNVITTYGGTSHLPSIVEVMVGKQDAGLFSPTSSLNAKVEVQRGETVPINCERPSA